MNNELIEVTNAIAAIEVIGIEIVSKCDGLCYPESYFEKIEMCKLCGKLS